MSFPQRMNRKQSANLFVKNLDAGIDDKRLCELFSSFGAITSAKVARQESGQSKGYGFVCYGADSEAALKAIFHMNGRLVAGKPIYVGAAQKKDQRQKLLAAQFSKSSDPDDAPKTTGCLDDGDDHVML